MWLELRQEFLSQQVYVELPEARVSPTSKSPKGSCAAPTTSREDIIDQMSQCELLVTTRKTRNSFQNLAWASSGLYFRRPKWVKAHAKITLDAKWEISFQIFAWAICRR